MRIVVLGAGGLLGRHVVEELKKSSSAADHQVVAFDRAACDIANSSDAFSATEGAGCIVNCAAWTNVDGAETNEDAAYRANALGAENVARAALRHDASLVHVSTDFVFDGTQKAPYDELDTPRPLSVYARSKWAGEELARAVTRKLFVVRVQGLYGAGGANFSSKLRALIQAGTPLKLDSERRVQPTWARAAARQIVGILSTELFGVYHVSCKGAASWAEFARHVAATLGVPSKWEEVATSSLKAPAARPANSLFKHRMLALRGLDVMPEWNAALDEYLAEEAARDRT